MLGVWSIVCTEGNAVGARAVAALARALSACGKRVLVLELASLFPALDFAFGVAERVVYTLSDIGRISAKSVFLHPAKCGCRKVKEENILFVPCAVNEALCDAEPIRSAIFAAEADITLILASPAHMALSRAVSDGMLLMTGTGAAELRCASALAESVTFDGALISDFVPIFERIKDMPPLIEIADMTSLPLFGILPRESGLETDIAEGKDFRTAAENIAERLLGKQIPLLRGIGIAGMRKQRFFERT